MLFDCCAACTGPIPHQLGALIKLEYLRLDGNALTGEGCNFLLIPIESIFSIFVDSVPPTREWDKIYGDRQKRVIFFLFPRIRFALLLTGSIPPELGNLAALEILSLGGNQLSGG